MIEKTVRRTVIEVFGPLYMEYVILNQLHDIVRISCKDDPEVYAWQEDKHIYINYAAIILKYKDGGVKRGARKVFEEVVADCKTGKIKQIYRFM